MKLLHPYLNFKIKTAHDLQIVIKTEKILELTVPLMHHPSADWLKLLEMDLMKIIMFSANEAIEGAELQIHKLKPLKWFTGGILKCPKQHVKEVFFT